MPLTSAIQSAMAIRHEREKREQRRLSKIRRESGRPSWEGDMEELPVIAPTNQSDSSLTTFHMGVVFILLGFLMIFSSMIPSSLIDADWSRLLGVGVIFIFMGLMMVMVNRIITAKEEEELSKYVKQRLSRTRSGHPFIKDQEQPVNIPSAMKKSSISGGATSVGGGPTPSPKSPKDKVTFAEFKNEVYNVPALSSGGRKLSRSSGGSGDQLQVPGCGPPTVDMNGVPLTRKDSLHTKENGSIDPGQLSSVPETHGSYTETSVSVPPLTAVRNGSIKRSRRESGSGIGRKTSLGEKTGDNLDSFKTNSSTSCDVKSSSSGDNGRRRALSMSSSIGRNNATLSMQDKLIVVINQDCEVVQSSYTSSSISPTKKGSNPENAGDMAASPPPPDLPCSSPPPLEDDPPLASSSGLHRPPLLNSKLLPRLSLENVSSFKDKTPPSPKSAPPFPLREKSAPLAQFSSDSEDISPGGTPSTISACSPPSPLSQTSETQRLLPYTEQEQVDQQES